jgi:hypothetical protein
VPIPLGATLDLRSALPVVVEKLAAQMTLPDTPFVCENIDVGALRKLKRCTHKPIEGRPRVWYDRAGSWGDMMGQGPGEFCERCVYLQGYDAEEVIAAALGEVIPAEVESYWVFPGTQRYVTKFQPVVSDKE